jgi:hypothetical protein
MADIDKLLGMNSQCVATVLNSASASGNLCQQYRTWLTLRYHPNKPTLLLNIGKPLFN